MIYDLVIIGAGPAGITAAIYASRKRLDTLVISKDIGGQAALSGDVENYTGYQFITGPELALKFEEHLKKFDITLKEGETALELGKVNNLVKVKTDKGFYEAKSAIIASGKRSRELGAPGEKEFKNKGLTYCATCDGPLFSGQDVAVIGGGNSALDAAIQLIKIANKIYLVNIADALTGDPMMREIVQASSKVTILNNSRVSAVLGDSFGYGKPNYGLAANKMVNAIRVNIADKEELLAVKGVFVEIGLIPNSEFVPGLEKNSQGEIKVNSCNETNVPGIFAAGDVTDVPEKQIVIAAGEGSKAALGVFRYLIHNK